MKRFLGKKLVVSFLSTLLILGIVAGGALAYQCFSGSAKVTVNEAITVTCINNGGGTWDGTLKEWAVSMYPAQTKSLVLRLANASSGPIDVTVGVTVFADPSVSGAGVYTVPASGLKDITFTATATQSAAPNTYSYTITFSR